VQVELSRSLRFAVSRHPDAEPDAGSNGYGGVPGSGGLAAHYQLTVTCAGEVDPRTGYLINIKTIDAAARRAAVGAISRAFAADEAVQPPALLLAVAERLAKDLDTPVRRVRWSLSATHSLEYDMSKAGHAVMRQRFEFAASHRLHVEGLSAEENQRLFGKCNHPSGHGHNYVVEPAVVVAIGPRPTLTLARLEAIVAEQVIERFDHKHLNLDTTEFGQGGLNPSVENIAAVIHGLLDGPIRAAGASLRDVTVWETDRTSSTYPAP
jgi:6-pyruvoyltetrahydropterin/6-carboxytetrahydropterin synthase